MKFFTYLKVNKSEQSNSHKLLKIQQYKINDYNIVSQS